MFKNIRNSTNIDGKKEQLSKPWIKCQGKSFKHIKSFISLFVKCNFCRTSRFAAGPGDFSSTGPANKYTKKIKFDPWYTVHHFRYIALFSTSYIFDILKSFADIKLVFFASKYIKYSLKACRMKLQIKFLPVLYNSQSISSNCYLYRYGTGEFRFIIKSVQRISRCVCCSSYLHFYILYWFSYFHEVLCDHDLWFFVRLLRRDISFL